MSVKPRTWQDLIREGEEFISRCEDSEKIAAARELIEVWEALDRAEVEVAEGLLEGRNYSPEMLDLLGYGTAPVPRSVN